MLPHLKESEFSYFNFRHTPFAEREASLSLCTSRIYSSWFQIFSPQSFHLRLLGYCVK